MSFDKKAFMAAMLPKTQIIEVEGFGSVTLKQLTLTESDALRASVDKDDKSSAFGVRLVAASIVDDDGDRVFSNEEIAELSKTAEAPMTKLMDAVMVLNGYRKGNNAKNSETVPSADSVTA